MQHMLGTFHALAANDECPEKPMEQPRFKSVSGHVPLFVKDIIEDWYSQPVRDFTFLREPVDRLVSFYRFHHRGQTRKFFYKGSSGLMEQAIDASLALIPFFEQPIIKWYCTDQVTRFLGCAKTFLEPVDEAMLERAIENLKNMWFVGIFERIEDDLRRLGELTGWPLKYIPHGNENPFRIEPSEEETEYLMGLTEYDRRLYGYQS